MIKELISKYGKEKINTLTKYPSILTLHRIGEKGRLTEELTTPIQGEVLYATEKIDGFSQIFTIRTSWSCEKKKRIKK